MTCSGCGAPTRPDFAFCPRCGRPQAAPAAPPPAAAPTDTDADRRLVTVLFADLSGFTALSERLDPEDIRRFQNELFQALASVVTGLGGFVEKFVGDAVMSVFGAPVAHEDDPVRALRAALAMLDTMRTLSERWESCFNGPVTLHVGVNTGPVVAGTLGTAAASAYAVTGDTVNTAARLLAAAEPGTILASASTQRLARHAIELAPRGRVEIKGKAEPVEVYGVLGVLPAPRSARGLDELGLTAPLIGRDAESARLAAAFDAMQGGRAQIVSVVGDAGLGKSRLLAECCARAEREGRLATTTVRRAQCSSLGEPPYGVLASFLREAYDLGADDPLEVARHKLVAGLRALGAGDDEVAAVAPTVGLVLGLEPAERLRHVDPLHLHRQIMLAARTIVERRLEHGPLVLIVEDLQWADAASVGLLRAFVERLAGRAFMLVVTQRPALEPAALATTRVPVTVVRLAPLSREETGTLLDAYFGPGVLPERRRGQIIERAGGNPLYVEESVRALVEAGALTRDDAGWRCVADAARLEVPATLQGLLLSRLDRLPADVRRVVQEAAVLGPVFETAPLRAIASDPAGCDAALRALAAAGLVEEVERARYRFAHGLLQEVVYQNLLVSRRTELHQRAGQAIEALGGDAPERLEDLEALGHHFSLGADRVRGARYLLTAGDRARAVSANEDAVGHYQRALAILEAAGGGPDALEARERLGDLLGPMGERAAALAHYDVALRAHAAAGDRGAQARLCRKIGGLCWEAGDRERALEQFTAGLVLLEGDAGSIETAYLYQEMGRLAFRAGDNDAAVDWAERALARLTRDGGHEAAAVEAQAYNTLGVARARQGRLEEAVAHIERSVEIAEAGELLQAACRGYSNLGVLYSTLDPQRSIDTCRRGLATAKRIGDLGVQPRLYANLAVAYCALTNQCEAAGLEAAEAAIDLDRRLGQLDHLAVPLIVLGQIHQCHGDPGEALRYYREALAIAEPIGEPQLLFPCYDGLATLHLDLGDDAEAEGYLVKAKQVCERSGLDPDSLVVLPFLS